MGFIKDKDWDPYYPVQSFFLSKFSTVALFSLLGLWAVLSGICIFGGFAIYSPMWFANVASGGLAMVHGLLVGFFLLKRAIVDRICEHRIVKINKRIEREKRAKERELSKKDQKDLDELYEILEPGQKTSKAKKETKTKNTKNQKIKYAIKTIQERHVKSEETGTAEKKCDNNADSQHDVTLKM